MPRLNNRRDSYSTIDIPEDCNAATEASSPHRLTNLLQNKAYYIRVCTRNANPSPDTSAGVSAILTTRQTEPIRVIVDLDGTPTFIDALASADVSVNWLIAPEFDGSVTLSDPTSKTPTVTAATAGTYLVSGSVTDEAGQTRSVSVELVATRCTTERQSRAPFRNSGVSGAGTDEQPFLICNATQLAAISTDLAAHYVLGADIDLSQTQHSGQLVDPDDSVEGDEYFEGWIPIGTRTPLLLVS